MLSKVIIPAAGLGTRLFPATREQPNEMLPIFSKISNGSLLEKPVIQVFFEQLYAAGLRQRVYMGEAGNVGNAQEITILEIAKKKQRNNLMQLNYRVSCPS